MASADVVQMGAQAASGAICQHAGKKVGAVDHLIMATFLGRLFHIRYALVSDKQGLDVPGLRKASAFGRLYGNLALWWCVFPENPRFAGVAASANHIQSASCSGTIIKVGLCLPSLTSTLRRLIGIDVEPHPIYRAAITPLRSVNCNCMIRTVLRCGLSVKNATATTGANGRRCSDLSLYSFGDWVELHGLDLGVVSQIVSDDRNTYNFREAVCAQNKMVKLSIEDRDTYYKNVIIPALSLFASDSSDLLVVRFDYLSSETTVPPHTTQTDAGPVIVMCWRSRLEDLICLAHESGHALQFLNSRGGKIPPLIRETAAFLSELLVIDHVRKEDAALADALCQAWDIENGTYLGGDLVEFRRVIDNPMSPYHYRHNYPLARILAVELFCNGDDATHRAVFDGQFDLSSLIISILNDVNGDAKIRYSEPRVLWDRVVDTFCQSYPDQAAEIHDLARNLVVSLRPNSIFDETRVVSRFFHSPILRCAYRNADKGMRSIAAGLGEALALANKPGLVGAPLSAALGLAVVAKSENCDLRMTTCLTGLSKSARFEVMAGHVADNWVDLDAQNFRIAPVNEHHSWKEWRSVGALALGAFSRGGANVRPDDFLTGNWDAVRNEMTAEQDDSKFDALTALGMAVYQLASSPYHRQFCLSHYLPVEIIPALQSGQALTVLSPDCHPAGLVTWAWISEDVEAELHGTGRALSASEWQCGTRLFFNDWIVEPAFLEPVFAHMTEAVFPDKIATSLRRNANGGVRRINRWTGANIWRSAQTHLTADPPR